MLSSPSVRMFLKQKISANTTSLQRILLLSALILHIITASLTWYVVNIVAERVRSSKIVFHRLQLLNSHDNVRVFWCLTARHYIISS
jgi:hypothetical protein